MDIIIKRATLTRIGAEQLASARAIGSLGALLNGRSEKDLAIVTLALEANGVSASASIDATIFGTSILPNILPDVALACQAAKVPAPIGVLGCIQDVVLSSLDGFFMTLKPGENPEVKAAMEKLARALGVPVMSDWSSPSGGDDYQRSGLRLGKNASGLFELAVADASVAEDRFGKSWLVAGFREAAMSGPKALAQWADEQPSEAFFGTAEEASKAKTAVTARTRTATPATPTDPNQGLIDAYMTARDANTAATTMLTRQNLQKAEKALEAVGIDPTKL
jgi:hypothetical protein